jgi:16S rRNA processing protein RimM
MSASESPADWVWLARIRRPQGRKGEVFAELLTDFPQKFTERRQLWLLPAAAGSPRNRGRQEAVFASWRGATDSRPRGGDPSHSGARKIIPVSAQTHPAELTNHWLHKGGVVLHFAGIDSISAAEALKGLIVAIPGAQRAQLPDGEAYISDLIGCMLVDVASHEPSPVGAIEDVDRTAGPVPLLVVRGPRGEILVPYARSYLRRVDLAAKRVEMALPEGLADLNSTP